MSTNYFLTRLWQILLTLVGISVIVFGLARMSGDPVTLMAPQGATQEDIADLRAKLGLDAPLIIQYWRFISRTVQGDFGKSVKWGVPALEIVLERFPATLLLSISALIFGFSVAVPIGVFSAVHRGTIFDGAGKVIALIGQSVPTFWIGLILIITFALRFPIFPTSGIGTFEHLVLPSITLGGFVAAAIMRITRSAMIDALESDYVRTARSKGIAEWRVIWQHALKNAAIPIVTITGLMGANILRGAVVTESVFAWPGVGKLAVDAVYARDFPLVQAAVLFMGVVFTAVNFLVDLLYGALDPRIRYEKHD